MDGDKIGDNSDADDDGDGVDDLVDAFPKNRKVSVDIDNDGIPAYLDGNDDGMSTGIQMLSANPSILRQAANADGGSVEKIAATFDIDRPSHWIVRDRRFRGRNRPFGILCEQSVIARHRLPKRCCGGWHGRQCS